MSKKKDFTGNFGLIKRNAVVLLSESPRNYHIDNIFADIRNHKNEFLRKINNLCHRIENLSGRQISDIDVKFVVTFPKNSDRHINATTRFFCDIGSSSKLDTGNYDTFPSHIVEFLGAPDSNDCKLVPTGNYNHALMQIGGSNISRIKDILECKIVDTLLDLLFYNSFITLKDEFKDDNNEQCFNELKMRFIENHFNSDKIPTIYGEISTKNHQYVNCTY